MGDTSTRPPKRRLPFERTVPRKKTPDSALDGPGADALEDTADSDEDLQFFRRNLDPFPYFEDLEAPKADKKKESSRPSSTGKSEDQRDHKRRRVSLEQGAELDSGLGSSDMSPRRLSPPFAPISGHLAISNPDNDVVMDVKGKGKVVLTPPRRGSPRRTSAGTGPKNPISLDDNDDECEPASPFATFKHDHPPRRTGSGPGHAGPLSLHDSDPEVLAIEEGASPEVEVAGVGGTEEDDSDDDFALEIEQARERERARAKASAMGGGRPAGGAIISIMVDAPRLPNVVACSVMCRVERPLSAILDAWVQLQATKGNPLPPSIKHKLFLTWRRNKVFGAASALTLPGFEIDHAGNIKGNALAGKDRGFYGGGLYLEAWTEELLAEHERERQRERQLSFGFLDEEDLEDIDEPAPQEAKQPKGIRLILKAKKLEPVKLTVQTHTTVDTMINAFRQQRGLDGASAVSIFFDGEELEPDSQVSELDIDPGDTNQFEVHIK